MGGHRANHSSEKECAWPDVPMSTVGCALATTSASPIRSDDFSCHVGDAIAALSETRLKRLQAVHALHQQAFPINQVKAAAGIILRYARLDHGAQQKRANSGARRAGAEHRNALLSERHAWSHLWRSGWCRRRWRRCPECRRYSCTARSRYCASRRLALPKAKSSQCSSTCGQRARTASTNAATNSS